MAAALPGLPARPRAIPRLADLTLPEPRVTLPAGLAATSAREDRASHTYGKAYRDVVRALAGDLRAAPDVVGRPETEADVVHLTHVYPDGPAP